MPDTEQLQRIKAELETIVYRIIKLECMQNIHADWEWRWDGVKICTHCEVELPDHFE